MATQKSPSRARLAYKFIEAHSDEHSVEFMCRLLGVARAGYYAWLQKPISDRVQEDARLLKLIRASFIASHGIYGAPRVLQDLRERGETCSKHRVARLMRENGLRALHGYRIRHIPVSKPPALIPNLLQRQFTVSRKNEACGFPAPGPKNSRLNIQKIRDAFGIDIPDLSVDVEQVLKQIIA